ncbi:MAG: PleD family two-component system response regulator [Desulfobacterales bacterium]
MNKRLRILIVDDEPANIKILGSALKEEYQISFATGGEQALKIAGSDTDLILLDIMMQDMNGYEVCRKLKGSSKTRNIPVIFITTMSNEEDETRGLEAGAVDYITKPFSMAIVKARVRTHLELKRHRDMLEHLSSLDGLTGIPNRRRFDEFLEQEWRRGMRDASRLSLIMIDIDYFKSFNDTYGHCAGDDCLRKVAKTLAESVGRPSDLVARYGGEEFAAVLPKTDREGAVFVAEIMRRKIESLDIPHRLSRTAGHVTVSIGTATIIPAPGTDLSALINCSDCALYEAKHSGRNQLKSVDLT